MFKGPLLVYFGSVFVGVLSVYFFFFVFVLKTKGEEKKKARAVGWVERWEGSGRNLGKGKHDKNILYKRMFFNYKNYEPTPTLRKKKCKRPV